MLITDGVFLASSGQMQALVGEGERRERENGAEVVGGGGGLNISDSAVQHYRYKRHTDND